VEIDSQLNGVVIRSTAFLQALAIPYSKVFHIDSLTPNFKRVNKEGVDILLEKHKFGELLINGGSILKRQNGNPSIAKLLNLQRRINMQKCLNKEISPYLGISVCLPVFG